MLSRTHCEDAIAFIPHFLICLDNNAHFASFGTSSHCYCNCGSGDGSGAGALHSIARADGTKLCVLCDESSDVRQLYVREWQSVVSLWWQCYADQYVQCVFWGIRRRRMWFHAGLSCAFHNTRNTVWCNVL